MEKSLNYIAQCLCEPCYSNPKQDWSDRNPRGWCSIGKKQKNLLIFSTYFYCSLRKVIEVENGSWKYFANLSDHSLNCKTEVKEQENENDLSPNLFAKLETNPLNRCRTLPAQYERLLHKTLEKNPLNRFRTLPAAYERLIQDTRNKSTEPL